MFVLAAAIVVAAFMLTRPAFANPDQILDNYFSGTAAQATTTPTYLTIGGTATTTNSFDTQNDGGLPAKSATLLVALMGSTTATTLTISFEFSQNNQDWFGDLLSQSATTTTQVAFGAPAKYTLAAATSSASAVGGNTFTGNTVFRAFTMPTPTRYIRAVFSISSSTSITANGGNGSVWSDIVGKKETR